MGEYPSGSVEDREMLVKMPLEKLLDFSFLQIRNLWRVDGLYFLGIEKSLAPKLQRKLMPVYGRLWLKSKLKV
ncbi:MAG: hypothetical protein ACE5OW_05185 [Candidatus Bathyarchaeia archaeon]